MQKFKFDSRIKEILEGKTYKKPRQGDGQRQSDSGYHTTDKQKSFKRQNLKRELEKELHESASPHRMPEMMSEKWRNFILMDIQQNYSNIPKETVQSAISMLVNALSHYGRG